MSTSQEELTSVRVEHGERTQAAGPVPLFDVTRTASLRRHLGHAATALKTIGFFSAISLGVHLADLGSTFAIVAALLAPGCASVVAKRLRSGRTWAVWLAAIWLVLFAAEVLRPSQQLRAGLSGYSLLGLTLFFLPLYFLARGLIAFAADRARRRPGQVATDPLALHRYEEGLRIKKRPGFINKKSVAAYGFLMLSPLPYLLVWLGQLNRGVTLYSDQAELIGAWVGAAAVFLALAVWGTRIYRRARRAAMLPGSALMKRDTRPFVLYLRSFHDDSSIKLRARVANGRILPERLIRIPFEEVVTDHLWGYGPVLAIGNPQTESKPAPLGAARDYVADSMWHGKVTELMREAAMIVAVAGGSEGLRWEIDTIAGLGLAWKLVLLLPPVGVQELQARWRTLTTHAGNEVLPAQIELARARAVVFPKGRAVVIAGRKGNDWTYEASLDEAALLIANERDAIHPAASSRHRVSRAGEMRRVLGAIGSDLASIGTSAFVLILVAFVYIAGQYRNSAAHPYASPGRERDSFVLEMTQVCRKDNPGMSADQLEKYCACFSGDLADGVVFAEIKDLDSDPTALRAKARSVAAACARKTLGR